MSPSRCTTAHLDQVCIGDRGWAALNRHRTAVDEDGSGRVTADNDAVDELVAEGLKLAGGFEKLR